jgi:hypothetical protein
MHCKLLLIFSESFGSSAMLEDSQSEVSHRKRKLWRPKVQIHVCLELILVTV